MRRCAEALCFAALCLLLSHAAPAEDDPPSPKESWAKLGRGVRSVTRETGHAFRDAAKATSAGAKDAAGEVADATRDEREEAADASKGLWARASQGLAEAFDDLAEAIASLRSDTD
jgi:hypothetical protein